METASLHNGTQMPLLGFGTWNCESVELAVTTALAAGYRHVDCAFLYNNEEHVGRAIQQAFKKGTLARKDLFLVSKLPTNGHRSPNVRRFLKTSLANLGVEYLDLYLIHHPFSTKYVNDDDVFPVDGNGQLLLDEDHDLLDTWKQLEECVDEGLTRNIGLSNFDLSQIVDILENSRIKPAVLQVECHVYLQQKQLIEKCRELGIVVTAYGALGSNRSEEAVSVWFPGSKMAKIPLFRDQTLMKIAEKHGKTPAQVAMRFWVQQGVCVIPKSSREERILQNRQLFDFTLDKQDLEEIRNLDSGKRIFDFKFLKGVEHSRKYPFGSKGCDL